ncbi:MAG: ATP-binding protein [Methylovulum sp.]|uniref:sensor histidine kinase n=1 Tax=Methylovulum sp. TaxID=1916980 RepID=UPI00260616E2|nr:ATP-binding protein [Methylovulum sp.]MDD2724818.1 ATP-binding protein [Methylovulum sp.]MDD5124064.1 ATP-binding protein [Methylovulum sp.]
MTKNSPDRLYPCPFSKAYSIPAQQAWTLLKVFLIYRLVLATLFILLIYQRIDSSLLSGYYNELYIYSSQSYWLLTIISVVCVFWRLTPYTVQAQLLIFTDIILLTLLMHACGGIKCGLGILITVSIASGGLLIGGVCSVLFAAIASLSILAERIFTDQLHGFDPSSYTYTGMLGAAYFTIALLSYVLAKHSEDSMQLADQQQKTIVNLEYLNQYIIQNLQSGIIIIDQEQSVLMVNEATLRLANLDKSPNHLSDVSPQLSRAFSTWLNEPEADTVSLPITNQSEIRFRFMLLSTHYDNFYMIILEDIALYNQRVQQGKLASLGRLTASIAHEIRNPLAAVSHAGQLLAESVDMPPGDRRLTNIIQTQSNRINVIIEDILRVSKRHDSKRKRLELTSWLDNYLKSFLSHHQHYAHSFELVHNQTPLYAFIDPNHLRQILNNLCENALKYGKPELGHILVQSFIFQELPYIEVIDNGTGISHQHLKNLFEPFFTTSPNGTGLGLYISKELAELNQAKLSYYLADNNRGCFRLCMLNAEKNLIEI